VASNMGFALMLARVPKEERMKKVRAAAKILQLEDYLDRRPGQLSGGQRQRVAIGRAIVRQPKVFLFDEPLSNLDAALRIQMRIELAKLHRELKATMIYVTHDQVEAMTMADRIVVLRSGVVEQIGTPLELYNHPANTFVAGFIGSPKMNLVPATVVAGGGLTAELPGGSKITLKSRAKLKAGEKVTLGIRPESLAIDPKGSIDGTVAVVEHLGGETLVYVDIHNGQLVTAKSGASETAKVGQKVRLSTHTNEPHLFAADGRVITN
jgi:multiple sugar transport system ATP-binding protein